VIPAKKYFRDDFPGALMLLVVVVSAAILLTHVRLSDADDLLSRSISEIAAAVRNVLN
jgi:hypothetical protein